MSPAAPARAASRAVGPLPDLAASPAPFFVWGFPSDLFEGGGGNWCIAPWPPRGPGIRPGGLAGGPRDHARGLRWWGGGGHMWAYPSPEAAAAAAAGEPEARDRAYRRWDECVVLQVELLGPPGAAPLPLADGRVLAPFLRLGARRWPAAPLAGAPAR